MDFKELIQSGASNNDVIPYMTTSMTPILSTGVRQDVWNNSGIRDVMESAETLNIVSDSANDTAAGTGARGVIIEGLDANWDIKRETIALNGTSAVTTAGTYRRVRRITISTAGSNHTNDGTITLTENGGSSTQAIIDPDMGVSQNSHITIPAGYKGIFVMATYGLFLSDGTTTKTGTLQNMIRINSADGADYKEMVSGVHGITSEGNGVIDISHLDITNTLPERTDYWVSTEVNTNKTKASVHVCFVVIRSTYIDALISDELKI